MNKSETADYRKIMTQKLDPIVASVFLKYAEEGKRKELQQLIPAHGKILAQSKDSYQRTALHWAAIGNHVEIISILLDIGVDVNAKDHRGNTALHCAALIGADKAISILLERSNIDINAVNNDKATALHLIASINSDKALFGAMMLKSKGTAKLDARDKDRRTVFDRALTGSKKMLSILTGGSTAFLEFTERQALCNSLLLAIKNVQTIVDDPEIVDHVKMLSTLLDLEKPTYGLTRTSSWPGTLNLRSSDAELCDMFLNDHQTEDCSSNIPTSSPASHTRNVNQDACPTDSSINKSAIPSASDISEGDVLSPSGSESLGVFRQKPSISTNSNHPFGKFENIGISVQSPCSAFSPTKRSTGFYRSESIPERMNMWDNPEDNKKKWSLENFRDFRFNARKTRKLLDEKVMKNPPRTDFTPAPDDPSLLPTSENVDIDISDDEIDKEVEDWDAEEEREKEQAKKDWEAFEYHGTGVGSVTDAPPKKKNQKKKYSSPRYPPDLSKCPPRYKDFSEFRTVHREVVKNERIETVRPLRSYVISNMNVEFRRVNKVDWLARFYWQDLVHSGHMRKGLSIKMNRRDGLKWKGQVQKYRPDGYVVIECWISKGPEFVKTPAELTGSGYYVYLDLPKNDRALFDSAASIVEGADIVPNLELLLNSAGDISNSPLLASDYNNWQKYKADPELCKLNESQKEAVDHALTHKFTLIQGPPGSGKTTTLIPIIVHLALSGEKLLITSASNQSMDLLGNKLMDQQLVDKNGIIRIAAHGRDYEDTDPISKVLLRNLLKSHPEYEKLEKDLSTTESSYVAVKEAKMKKFWYSRDLVNAGKIILATTAMSCAELLKHMKFDAVVVDEASTVSDPQFMGILSHFAPRIVLVGDHKQLGPYYGSQQLINAGFQTTVFQRMIENPNIQSIMLNKGYRMSREINDFPSKEFYSSNFQSTRLQPVPILFPWPTSKQIAYIFSNATENPNYPGTMSKYNPEEVVIVKHCVDIITSQNPDSSVLVLSTYAGQVEKLRQICSSKVRVSTIDGAQGEEADVVIISYVIAMESYRKNLKTHFVADLKRLNVGITRARDALILVGRMSLLIEIPIFRRLITGLQQARSGLRLANADDGKKILQQYLKLEHPSQSQRRKKYDKFNYVPHGKYGIGKGVPHSLKPDMSTVSKYFKQQWQEDATYVDSHCHLDFITRRYHLDYDALLETNNSEFVSKNFEGCITNFCDPEIYMDENGNQNPIIPEMNGKRDVMFTLGIHPKMAHKFSRRVELLIRSAQQYYSHFIAIGECGLDYSMKKPDKSLQKKIFGRQIRMALDMKLPLVLHARESQMDCFLFMKTYNSLEFHPIHFHCFDYDYQTAKMWMDSFPNLKFGFTLKILESRNMYETVKQLPLEKILVETDAPYMVPKAIRKDYPATHPQMALGVIGAIHYARGGNMDPSAVMKKIRENTRELYHV